MEKNILPQLEFYNQLSESYDQMISWPTRIGAEGMFFKKLVSDLKLKSSLDVKIFGTDLNLLEAKGRQIKGIIERVMVHTVSSTPNPEQMPLLVA